MCAIVLLGYRSKQNVDNRKKDYDDGCAQTSGYHWLYTEEHARGEIKCTRQVGRNVCNAESLKSTGIKVKHNYGVKN